jgi:hypothetical protein
MDKLREPTLHPSSLPLGAQVGKWRVEAWAGRGTNGAVYRAVEIGREQAGPVALKIAVHPEDPRFEREVALLSRIRHPNVPALRAHGNWTTAEGTYPYVVMQWVEGMPLYEWAALHNPSSREVLRLLAQLTRALAAIHEAQGVHRDMKGSNVLVKADGQAFLMDFGSSTYMGASLLTFEPLPPGTPAYRSPRAWQFSIDYRHLRTAHYAAEPSDDLFSLGVTAYRLVTDEYPTPTDPGEKESKLWYADKVSPPPPRALNPRVDSQLSAIILRMLSVQPEARGTLREIAELLEQRVERAGPQADQMLFAWEAQDPSEWSREDAIAASDLGHRPRRRIMEVVRATEQQDAEKRAGWEREKAEQLARATKPTVRSAPPVPRGGVFQPWMASAAAVLLVLGVLWVGSLFPPSERPVVAQDEPDEEPDAGTKDGGTAELAQEALTAYTKQGPPPQGWSRISLDIPPEPLPGQRRPDSNGQCRLRGELKIQGGCWFRVPDAKPPCNKGEYEWLSGCYHPSYTAPRPPTSYPPEPGRDAQ